MIKTFAILFCTSRDFNIDRVKQKGERASERLENKVVNLIIKPRAFMKVASHKFMSSNISAKIQMVVLVMELQIIVREHISRRRTFISYSAQGAIMVDQRESSWTYPNKGYDRNWETDLGWMLYSISPNEKRKREIPFIRVDISCWRFFSRLYPRFTFLLTRWPILGLKISRLILYVLSCLEIQDEIFN